MATLEDLTDLTGRVYNVLNHGVVGDGLTDDAAGFATAFAAAPSDSLVVIPPGTYVIGSVVTVPKVLHILGLGAVIKAPNTLSGAAFRVRDSGLARLYGGTIRGLKVTRAARNWTDGSIGF